MSEYRAYMQNTKLHNGTKRKKRRHRFLFGVLLSALLITGALYGREYDISVSYTHLTLPTSDLV